MNNQFKKKTDLPIRRKMIFNNDSISFFEVYLIPQQQQQNFKMRKPISLKSKTLIFFLAL